MIMAQYGMPAQAPQGWGNWQQGPGQVPNQQPFAPAQNNGQQGGGLGQQFRAANPWATSGPSGTGGGGAPTNMTPTPNPLMPGLGSAGGMPGGGISTVAGGAGGEGYASPAWGGAGGGMSGFMNMLMAHPAIQAMMGGMTPRGGMPPMGPFTMLGSGSSGAPGSGW